MKAQLDGNDPLKPSLLLVHGMLTCVMHWEPNIAALLEDFNLVRVDLPGHGESPAPDDPRTITRESLIAKLEDLREDLGLREWYICGQSFGGALTLNYANCHPERVTAQIFTNARTPLRDYTSADETAGRAERLALLRREGHAALRTEVFHPRNAKRFPLGLRDRLSAAAEQIDIGCYVQLLSQVIPSLSLFPLADHRPEVPTLLVNGRHERAFQPYRAALPAVWPEVEIVDLDGGHSINVENPDGFAQAVKAFKNGGNRCQAGGSITNC